MGYLTCHTRCGAKDAFACILGGFSKTRHASCNKTIAYFKILLSHHANLQHYNTPGIIK